MFRRVWRPWLPADVSALILGLLAFQAVNRGVDYFLGDRDTTTQSLTVVEQAMPLQAWGTIFCIGGLLVGFGMWRKRADPIVWGAVVLMATYTALAWGLMLRMIERGTALADFWLELGEFDLAGTVAAWPWDGWRTPTSFIVTAILWGFIGWGTRVMQRARGDGK